MGIGEGLLNTAELFPALEKLTCDFGMSPRRITVSTSGYIPGMEKFAQLKKEYNLAISLHAPDDVTRAKLIPDQLRYKVADILEAADNWSKSSGRQYTLEYTLVSGINDSVEHATALGKLAYLHHAKVNLIPYNETSSTFRRPALRNIELFEQTVAATGARVTRRVEKGKGAAAACGQLRAEKIKG
jgi:23S rRNA (adenine2503-C2)-methyltransferase